MKIYTNTFDVSRPSPHRFWVPPYSDFKIGIKLVNAGVELENDFTVAAGTTELIADETKIDGFTIYTLNSTDTGFVEYTITVDSLVQKFKLVQIVSDSTVFDIDERGGDMSQYATKNWVESEISGFVDEDALTAYATKDELTAYAETTDLTAYYTKSETSSATELADAFAGVGGGAISAFDMSEDPVMSKTMVENAIKTDTCLPQTIVQYTDNSISVYDIVGNLNIGTIATNSKKINFGTNLSSLSNPLPVYATSLEEVVIPDSVKVLTGRVFDSATKLNSVKGGNGISSFAVSNYYVNTFSGCTALSNFTLNNVLTSVGYAAFVRTSIKRITIPDNISALDGGCFGGGIAISSAIKIEVVDFGNTRTDVPTIGMVGNDWPFGPLTQVYVPDALYDTWIAATNWSSYEANIHRHSELEAPYATSKAEDAYSMADNAYSGLTLKVDHTAGGDAPEVLNITTYYESEYIQLSVDDPSWEPDPSTMYVILPDPVSP